MGGGADRFGSVPGGDGWSGVSGSSARGDDAAMRTAAAAAGAVARRPQTAAAAVDRAAVVTRPPPKLPTNAIAVGAEGGSDARSVAGGWGG